MAHIVTFIGGEEVTGYTLIPSISIQDKLDGRNTASLTLRDTGNGSPSAPEIGETISIVSVGHDLVDTYNEALDATETDIMVTDGGLWSAGSFYFINDEILYVESISGDNLTVQRGAIGSLATTHADAQNGYLCTVYFAGTIDQIETTPYTPDEDSHIYHLSCVDFNQTADRFIVAYRFTGATTGAMAISLVNDTGIYPQARTADTLNAIEGITAVSTASSGMVAPGVDVDEILFNYQTLTECLNILAGMTGFYWTIDYGKRLIFGEYGDTATTITEANKGSYVKYGSERKTETRDQYRNVQFLRGGFAVEAAIEETFSTTTSPAWLSHVTLTRPVGAAIADGDITDDAVAITGGVGVKNVSTGKGAYYQIGSPEIEFTSTASIGAGSVMRVTYQGQVPIMTTHSNEASIDERATAEGGSGLYAMIETTPDINALDGFDRGRALVTRYGVLPTTVTYKSDTVTWAAGSKQTVTLDSINVPETDFIITARSIFDMGNGTLQATYTLESAERRRNWIEWYTKIYKNQLRTFKNNEVLSYGRTYETETTIAAPF